MDAILKMAGIHQELFDARIQKDPAKYQTNLMKLPLEYRDRYHESFVLLAQFLFTLLDARRGAEGLELVTKKHWIIVEEGGKKFMKKVMILRHFGLYPMRLLFVSYSLLLLGTWREIQEPSKWIRKFGWIRHNNGFYRSKHRTKSAQVLPAFFCSPEPKK